MGAQFAIDFDAILPERVVGMERAAAKANRVDSEWTGQAIGQLVAYANEVQVPFFVEEARPWCYKHGLPKPPNEKAWGCVPRRAADKGQLMYVDHQRAPGNSCLKPRWQAVKA